ncbi:MAG: hypothetical protein AAF903_06730 [Pseudomonadota bacterium]
MSFLLRYGAIEFSNTVFDMQQLSAIRGGSLAFLYSRNAVADCLTRLLGAEKVTSVFAGASQGAWVLEADRSEAQEALKQVEAALAQNSADSGPHAHMAYTASIVEITGTVEQALIRAEALNAVQAQQFARLPLPTFDPDTQKPDTLGDRKRPAHKKVKLGQMGEHDISDAHLARRRFGSQQRQRFYRDFARQVAEEEASGPDMGEAFTHDFASLVENPPPHWFDPKTGEKRPLPVSVRGKTAVFYADGNRFSRLFAAAQTAQDLGELSAYLRQQQGELLHGLLEWYRLGAQTTPHAFQFTGDDGNPRYRLETLLFGGDEMLFVLPAWLALGFVSEFYRLMDGWRFGEKRLSFSGGLVIANANTPIRQTKALAEALAEENKARFEGEGAAAALESAEANGLQIEIFESLTVPDDDLAAYRQRLYFSGAAASDEQRAQLSHHLTIAGRDLPLLVERVEALLHSENSLPRSQLYRMLRDYTAMGGEAVRADLQPSFNRWKKRAGAASPISFQQLDLLHTSAENPRTGLSLSQAAMLYDYTGKAAAASAHA